MSTATKTPTVPEKLFREALYAVFNFGYGHENTTAGAQSDEGMELAVKVIYGKIDSVTLSGHAAKGYNLAQDFWKELLSQPDPVAYTKLQIERGLNGERVE
jgi:hypothetical protein